MTDKAAKRRKELAAKLGVPVRTAANIIKAKHDESRAEKPMKLHVLARSLGGGPPDAYIVNISYHPANGHCFGAAVAEARRLARERSDILQIHIRREDRPGFPFVCDWSRREGDPWVFSWQYGAEDRTAQPLTLEGVRAWPNMTPGEFETQVSAARLQDEYTMLRDALDQEMKSPSAEIDADKVREITFDLRIAQTSLLRRHSLSA
jgi:hypothetical protein